MANTLPHLVIPDAPLSVAGVTLYIQGLLETDLRLQQVWIVGEVSSASHHRSGLFFTLQDPDTDAALRCVMWKNRLAHTTTHPGVGEQVIVLGRVQIHRQRGDYQLNAWQILPAGEGLRALRSRQLRQRLDSEGLFNPAHKRSIPLHPHVIAVVTSPQAAAWGDIKRTIKRRYPGIQVLFSPARVQGTQAPASIIKAINRVEVDGRADVLIISRGGGASEDMECFNDEQVVRAIAQCSIPVIAGIGHQRDESLTDLVADAYAHTPTAAAEQATPRLSDVIHAHDEQRTALALALQRHFRSSQDQLRQLREQLQRLQIDQTLAQERQANQWRQQKLCHLVSRSLEQANHHCQLLKQQLSALDPATVLNRGYAVLRQPDGHIVRTADHVQPQQTLWVHLAKGRLQVTVTHVDLASESFESFESFEPCVSFESSNSYMHGHSPPIDPNVEKR